MPKKYSLLALFLVFVTTLTGVYVRLSGGDAVCQESLACLDHLRAALHTETAVPENVSAERWAIVGALAHRAIALLSGLAVLIVGVLAVRRSAYRSSAIVLVTASLIVVLAQAALGASAIAARQLPWVVASHLLLGYLLLGLLYSLHRLMADAGAIPCQANARLRWLARGCLIVVVVEIVLGAWTGANFAGLGCPDFPTCHGQAWPVVDYAKAFSPYEAASGANGATVDARAAIHWLHRLGALASFVLLTALSFLISSNPRLAALGKTGVWLSFWLLAEVALGIAAVLFRLPPVVVVAHAGVAALLLLTVLHANLRLRRSVAAATPSFGTVQGQLTDEELVIPVSPFPAPVVESTPAPATESVFDRLRSQLGKTRGGFTGALANLALGRRSIDREFLDEIEDRLLMADVGVQATSAIVSGLVESLERHELRDWDVVRDRLRTRLLEILTPCSVPLVIPPNVRPFVILVVGVNGVGKTTTIGKIAKHLQTQGHSVMLAAGDTFRAAAVEQLETWGERNGIPVIAQRSSADSASVIYDAVQSAKARSVDVLIADTAGRLHTKSNLMEELSKIKRIIGKLDPSAPHEVLLVLDAGTGQNAIAQARQFNDAVGLTGLALTKLDGTAKGGVIFALAQQFGVPIRYIGIGERIDDLQDFDAAQFVAALFGERLH